LLAFGEAGAHSREVEAHASAWAAEADGAQLRGVGVDPVAVDAELLCQLGRVHESLDPL
jgi:hypothetical protein